MKYKAKQDAFLRRADLMNECNELVSTIDNTDTDIKTIYSLN